MKRSPFVGLGTLAGIAGVLALNPAGTATLNAGSVSGASSGAAQGSGITSTDTALGTSTQSNGAKVSGSGSSVSGTATGDAVFVRWGNVQLKVTAKNGTITNIEALQLPNGDNRSFMISQQVEPMLRQQALAAQSARINGVSGATFTSTGYVQSLQSALDQLGL
jgi:uncharacterized protein with FMN-binding domain